MDFFNDLSKKFSHAARTVQERTREGVENTKIAMNISAARADLDRQLIDLGRAYYENVVNGGPEVAKSLIHAVRESMAQIESLTAQRDRMRQQARCPACGAAQPEEARFCANCGRPMPEKAPEIAENPAEEVQYCEQCGAMREGSARFCAVCGSSFLPEDNPPALTAAPAAEPLPAPEEPDSTDSYAE